MPVPARPGMAAEPGGAAPAGCRARRRAARSPPAHSRRSSAGSGRRAATGAKSVFYRDVSSRITAPRPACAGTSADRGTAPRNRNPAVWCRPISTTSRPVGAVPAAAHHTRRRADGGAWRLRPTARLSSFLLTTRPKRLFSVAGDVGDLDDDAAGHPFAPGFLNAQKIGAAQEPADFSTIFTGGAHLPSFVIPARISSQERDNAFGLGSPLRGDERMIPGQLRRTASCGPWRGGATG